MRNSSLVEWSAPKMSGLKVPTKLRITRRVMVGALPVGEARPKDVWTGSEC